MPNPRSDQHTDLPERTRDPGAAPAEVGVPGVADDLRHEGSSVPDPEVRPVPTEAPTAVTGYGTTAEEQRSGEPLERKLAREEPEGAEVRWAARDRPAEEEAVRVEEG